jgi:hypothetical protein
LPVLKSLKRSKRCYRQMKSSMQISEKYILEFKELMRKKVGEEEYNKMTEQELLHSATALITLMKAVYQPISKEDYDKYSEKKVNDRGKTKVKKYN